MENTFFYFFSTYAQVFGALMATLGVFVVFSLQYLQDSIEWSRKDLVQAMDALDLSENLSSLSLNNQLKIAKRHFRELPFSINLHSPFAHDAKHAVAVISEQKAFRKIVAKDFRRLLSAIASLLAASLISLPLATILTKAPRLGIALICLFLLAGCIVLFFVTTYIHGCLKRYPRRPNKSLQPTATTRAAGAGRG